MKSYLATFVFTLAGVSLSAETIVTTQTVRARSVITPADVHIQSGDTPGAIAQLSDVVGKEARVALYAGRPVMASDIGPRTLVERNQLVAMHYAYGGLTIKADARALGRAGAGEHVQVMNLSSRATLTARVLPDGSVIIDH